MADRTKFPVEVLTPEGEVFKDEVEMVSYLADSGFTLTVALNFTDHRLASIASNNEQWFAAQGTFDEVSA